MVGCVEGILGIRPDFYGLSLNPSVPDSWGEFEIKKKFRGKNLNIQVKNPNHVESGCAKLIVNGNEIQGNYIPENIMTDNTEIELYMS